MDLIQQKRAFNTDGICQIDRLIEPTMITALHRSFAKVCLMQATKLGLETSDIDADSPEKINRLVTRLNEKDRWALDNAAAMVRYTEAGYGFASSRALLEVVSALLDCPVDLIVISGPSIFINLPAKKIRLYSWHSEKYWYPKRRNFLNAWIPVFTDKRPDNGTMSVLPGSQTKDWSYFSEYFGYDEDTQGNTECNLQYELPESELTGFTPRAVQARQGEVVLFQSNLVHRSDLNISEAPSYTAGIRYFDFRRDLTLSANWTESPYRLSDPQRHGGRSNLRPANLSQ